MLNHRLIAWNPSGSRSLTAGWTRNWINCPEPGLVLLRLAGDGGQGRREGVEVKSSRLVSLRVPDPFWRDGRETGLSLCNLDWGGKPELISRDNAHPPSLEQLQRA